MTIGSIHSIKTMFLSCSSHLPSISYPHSLSSNPITNNITTPRHTPQQPALALAAAALVFAAHRLAGRELAALAGRHRLALHAAPVRAEANKREGR
jgi:hypothetical protein